MLSAEQSFRAGFLLRCAEEGLSQQQIDARLSSAEALAKTGSVDGSGWLQAVSDLPAKYLLSAAGTGILAGGTAGAALGLSMPEDLTKSPRPAYLDDVQRAELISTYRQQAEQMRRRAEIGRRRAARQATTGRSIFGI